MNSGRLNGTVKTDIEIKNTTGGGYYAMFLLEVPFEHPYVHYAENYQALLRIRLYEKNADWAEESLNIGDHVEIKHAFLITKRIGKYSFYYVVGDKIDTERSIVVPDDYEPFNIVRLSGFFYKQFFSGKTKEGVPKVGISISVLPDIPISTEYRTTLSVIVYGEDAERIDGKLETGDKIEYVEGPINSWRGDNKNYAVYVHATRIEI